MKFSIPKFFYSLFFFLLVPVFTFADQITGEVTIDKILKAINKEIINPAIIGIFAVALAVFIFGVVRFIWAKQQGDSYEKDGKSHMVWGLVGMFIMASAFGIIQFIANTLTLDFKINQDGTITNPGGGGDHTNQILGDDGVWYPKFTNENECTNRPQISGQWLYDDVNGVCDKDVWNGGGNNGGFTANTQSAEYINGYKQGFYDGYYKETPQNQGAPTDNNSAGYVAGYPDGYSAVDPLNATQCAIIGVYTTTCTPSRIRP